MSGDPHDHREFVAGCFRCELSRDEVSRGRFEGFLEPPKHAKSKAARVTTANPRSQVATDPYLAVEVEDFFRVTDHDSTVFGYPDTYEIHEITHSVSKGKLYGYGHRVLRDGTLSARPVGEAILLAWSDIPAHLHERLTP